VSNSKLNLKFVNVYSTALHVREAAKVKRASVTIQYETHLFNVRLKLTGKPAESSDDVVILITTTR